MHPPSGGYYGDFDGSTDLLHCSDVREFDFEGLVEADYIYFDPERDSRLAMIINDFHKQKAMSWIPWPGLNPHILYP